MAVEWGLSGDEREDYMYDEELYGRYLKWMETERGGMEEERATYLWVEGELWEDEGFKSAGGDEDDVWAIASHFMQKKENDFSMDGCAGVVRPRDAKSRRYTEYEREAVLELMELYDRVESLGFRTRSMESVKGPYRHVEAEAVRLETQAYFWRCARDGALYEAYREFWGNICARDYEHKSEEEMCEDWLMERLLKSRA